MAEVMRDGVKMDFTVCCGVSLNSISQIYHTFTFAVMASVCDYWSARLPIGCRLSHVAIHTLHCPAVLGVSPHTAGYRIVQY